MLFEPRWMPLHCPKPKCLKTSHGLTSVLHWARLQELLWDPSHRAFSWNLSHMVSLDMLLFFALFTQFLLPVGSTVNCSSTCALSVPGNELEKKGQFLSSAACIGVLKHLGHSQANFINGTVLASDAGVKVNLQFSHLGDWKDVSLSLGMLMIWWASYFEPFV